MYLNGVCFITDRTHARIPVYDMVRVVLEAGIAFVQYRDKEKSRHDICEEAAKLRELTRSFHATFIVNDYADIALAVDADGVHLGQDDLPVKEARRIMGKRIVGISTHSVEEAIEAASSGADYIGFGPIFQTSTKDAGPPKGVDIIRTIKQNVCIPVVAIGGIDLGHLDDVMDAGADAVAVATAICRGDISRNAHAFIHKINKGLQGSRMQGIR